MQSIKPIILYQMKKSILIYFLLLCSYTFPLKGSVDSSNIKINIITDYSEIQRGKKFHIGIVFMPKNEWHTYWMNAGDAGLPSFVELKLPKGLTAEKMQWEVPHKFIFAGMASFGFDIENMLVIPINAANDIPIAELEIKVQVKWLECKEECVPGKKDFLLKMPVIDSESISNPINADLFQLTRSKQSIKNNEIIVEAKKAGDGVKLKINLPDYLKNIEKLEFFPFENGYFDNAESQKFERINANVYLNIKYDKYMEKKPKKIYGLLVSDMPLSKDYPNKAIEINVEIK